MTPLLTESTAAILPEDLIERLEGVPGAVLLRGGMSGTSASRYSLMTAAPFLTLRSFGSRCELRSNSQSWIQYGNPWHVLDSLMSRYELLEDLDLPFPSGGCFGFWGYDLKNYVEPRLPRRAINDLELPDCHVGFYDSLVVFDHALDKCWIISSGLLDDGTRSTKKSRDQITFWQSKLQNPLTKSKDIRKHLHSRNDASRPCPAEFRSTLSRLEFLSHVNQIRRYIQSGDIYQVNLSRRITTSWTSSGWDFFKSLSTVSPAPFAAYVDCGEFQIASSSPEMFLRLSGAHIITRPIKGTRPRDADATRDAQLAYELQTSAKELAELVMITDLLRNDLGRVCEFGTVHVPDLVTLERYPQVQHLVSTVEGRLRTGVSHFSAFASCFPGGSITGAPKIRAMEIIDELEPVSRGPYTGSIGYLGFNRESQLNIAIRTAVCAGCHVHFHTGAGIVADSDADAEYEETEAKARGFVAALEISNNTSWSAVPKLETVAGHGR